MCARNVSPVLMALKWESAAAMPDPNWGYSLHEWHAAATESHRTDIRAMRSSTLLQCLLPESRVCIS